MALNFTIRNFIENRWAEAKEELLRRDPAYVSAVQSYISLYNKLRLPDSIHPQRRLLDERWIRLLEATVNVIREMENLDFTISLIKPTLNRRTSHYYVDRWLETAYNLCEKVKVLITHSGRMYGLGKKLIDNYCKQIDSSELPGKISLLRHPLVHGEGGKESVVRRAVSEDKKQRWEFYVAAGPQILDHILEYDSEQGLLPRELSEILSNHTTRLLANISGVLSQLEQDINKFKTRYAKPIN
jgi:hypothetical protein